MVFHKGDVSLAPGIEYLLVGGHARGQTVLRVNTARGWVILASDAVHVFEEIDEERPFAVFYDLPGMLEGYRRIKHLAGCRNLVIPGHDARVTMAYPAAAAGLEGQVLRLDKPPTW
jgi:glyoxylase-like metal-dependent hydrolase (beta-lactamase superfamily II)